MQSLELISIESIPFSRISPLTLFLIFIVALTMNPILITQHITLLSVLLAVTLKSLCITGAMATWLGSFEERSIATMTMSIHILSLLICAKLPSLLLDLLKYDPIESIVAKTYLIHNSEPFTVLFGRITLKSSLSVDFIESFSSWNHRKTIPNQLMRFLLPAKSIPIGVLVSFACTDSFLSCAEVYGMLARKYSTTEYPDSLKALAAKTDGAVLFSLW
jgi:hypothetical protein